MRSFAAKHWTIRLRLTLLYGGLFFLAGALLLGVTFLLVRQRLYGQGTDDAQITKIVNQRLATAASKSAVVQLPDGEVLDVSQAMQEFLAERQRLREETLNSLLTDGGLALLGVGAGAVAFGWLLAGRVLRPIPRITETARRIAGADGAGRGLHERIGLAGPEDEIKRLADTFDLMLERLDHSFDGQRRFVANASHELRTPLAIKRALIEVAITRPAASPDARELGTALLEVNDRHERLIDGLLTLADSENPLAEAHPVDLAEVAGHVLAQFADPAQAAGVRIRDPQLQPATTAGDPYLLERLVQNLVENAVRHNLPRDGWLSVRTAAQGSEVIVEVANSGPAVRRYEVEALFQPFRRLAERTGARGRGFGLGLSIVRAVAGAHGGHVRAEPRDDGGLVVTVTLPAN